MRASRGEIKIQEIPEMNNMNFQMEYTFPDLVSSSGRPLRFDFCVFDDNGAIDFLIEFFKLAKKKKVHTTIDTSGAPFTMEEPFYSKFVEL